MDLQSDCKMYNFTPNEIEHQQLFYSDQDSQSKSIMSNRSPQIKSKLSKRNEDRFADGYMTPNILSFEQMEPIRDYNQEDE